MRPLRAARSIRSSFRTAAALTAAAAVTAAVALAPTTAARAEDEPETPDGPSYGAPVVGECHDYGKKVYWSYTDTKPPVKCKEDHTAYTAAVLYLPDDMEWHQPTPEKFYAKVSKLLMPTCTKAERKALDAPWAKLMKTSYDGAYYEPTADQISHGARWIRCDLVLKGAPGNIQDLPARKPALKKITTAERDCLVLRDDGAYRTACNKKHHYKATHNHRLPAGKYPSSKKFQRYINKYCIGTAQHPGYGRLAPKDQWRLGNRILQCYEWDR
ncbi:septum formation family protein [Nocardioides sp. YIM 152588]|uniref:septum formation family protein n=1 Tax=Nocardioides sp. YIM 152588 TaxID=3158259 RepID=UPI0032E519C3